MRNKYVSKPMIYIYLFLFCLVLGCIYYFISSKTMDTVITGEAGNMLEEEDGQEGDIDFEMEVGEERELEEEEEIELVLYDGEIENIFFHPLIAYPEKAFDQDRYTEQMDAWFVTVDEFKKILQSLYENHYVLINIDITYDVREENGRQIFERKPFLFPKNKKPLVISIDDVNYYTYMKENGTVHKLILDENNNIATFTQFPNEEPIISYDGETITILEDFIKEHKDFSYQGARGIIALTGYNGVLGYNTHKPSAPEYQEELEKATAVIERLKEMGWLFSSHGYAHLDARKASYEAFVRDCERWEKQVGSLVGPTDLYIYPFGSDLKTSDPKFKHLLDLGFRVFFGVHTKSVYNINQDYLITRRIPIDGYCLKGRYGDMSRFFDIKEIIDERRPGVKK